MHFPALLRNFVPFHRSKQKLLSEVDVVVDQVPMCFVVAERVHDGVQELHRQVSRVREADVAGMQLLVPQDDFFELRLDEGVILDLRDEVIIA